MKERSSQPTKPGPEDERPEVYSITQDEDGSFRFSRRDLLSFGAAIGGTLLLRAACPRFGVAPAPGEAVQAGMAPLTSVYVHAEPSIASDIAAILKQDDLVRVVGDHADLGWVEIATQSGQRGWVERSSVDFSRAIRSSSPDFDLSSAVAATPTQTPQPLTISVRKRTGGGAPAAVLPRGEAHTCAEAIQNGNFEAGQPPWVEESGGYIVRNDYPVPYQGSYVAWFGGLNAVERLTQLFRVPKDAEDAQTLEFYMRVESGDPWPARNDTFHLRFLDGDGSPISPDVFIADNTDRTDWVNLYLDLTGISGFRDRNIQLQFEAAVDSTYYTYFVVDLVSLDMACEGISYVYVPLILRDLRPAATATPPPTATPTATPCPSHDPCPSYCYSDCGYDCSSDCTYDCSTVCTLDCVYDCTFDCIYDCGYN
jgi:hypothetical protein